MVFGEPEAVFGNNNESKALEQYIQRAQRSDGRGVPVRPCLQGSQFHQDFAESKAACSLSKTYQNGLMWSFYANEHKGVCIELEPNTSVKDWHLIDVDYVSNIAMIGKESATVDNVLSNKSSQWSYEQEVIFIRTVDASDTSDRKRYLRAKILRIFLGIRMVPKDKRFITRLIKSVAPTIDVVEMKRENIDFGFGE